MWRNKKAVYQQHPMHWLAKASKKRPVSQGWAWQCSCLQMALDSFLPTSFYLWNRRTHVSFNRVSESLRALPWDPTMWMRPSGAGPWEGGAAWLPYRPRDSALTHEEPELCHILRVLPSKAGPTLLFWFIFRWILFTESALQHNGVRCSSGNMLYSLPPHVSMLGLCLEFSILPWIACQNFSCTVHSLNFPSPCPSKHYVISPLAPMHAALACTSQPAFWAELLLSWICLSHSPALDDYKPFYGPSH